MNREANALFEPKSVAVYGASATDPGKLGNTLLANLSDSEGNGSLDIVCVHPSAAHIGGRPAVRSLDRPVDLAVVSVPARAAESAVADAVVGGAKVLVVLSSGFGEAGPEGRAVQDRLVAMARGGGARLVGPNCMGAVSHLGGGSWLNGSYFWSVPRHAGGLSFLSQSGAFGGMFLAEVRQRELGFARFLSLGNSADLEITEALQWFGEDDRTEVIAVFAEGLRDGRAFVDVAGAITPHKPVVVLKGGRSKAGARAAAGHTGTLAGSSRAYDAAFRRAGVTAVTTSEQFFDTLTAFATPTLRRHGRRVAIVTISGGPGVLASDAAERAGLELPQLPVERQHRIRAHAPEFAATANPVDLTPQCRPDQFPAAIAEVYREESVDGVIVINCGLDIREFGIGVAEAHTASGKPTTAFLLDVPAVQSVIAGAGIPCLASPEAAVRAYAAGAAR
ncbi:acetate--CoA ligase family protein [Actinocrispum wychmicini]|uniref:acetate--CoA ligase family protein n=1 Tax=Actinocrispum wychmicini TaxID=1213861 RepID=UPI001404A1D1|nr:CoA-binding protein [Actinocrispum wychmicini]